MKPQTIGRVLGVGIRVAGRMAGQRLTGGGQPGAGGAADRPVTVPGIGGRTAGRTAGRTTGGLARGIKGFVRPFRRLGGILFLEVVGVFFFIFVLVFAQTMWRMRASYAHGPDHQKFLIATGLLVLFLYLTISSFWRAQRK